MLVALRKLLGNLGFRGQVPEFVKIVIAAAIMGGFVWFAMGRIPIVSGTYKECLLWTVLIAGGAALIYAALLLVLRVKILRELIARVLPARAGGGGTD
jgi:hypothetical protein